MRRLDVSVEWAVLRIRMKETASSVSFLTRLNMRKILLSELKTVASNRAEGYYDACIAAGKVTGEFLYLETKDFASLRAQFPPVKPQVRGLGDVVHNAIRVADRITGGAIDKLSGGKVSRPCNDCKRRRNKLNQMFPL